MRQRRAGDETTYQFMVEDNGGSQNVHAVTNMLSLKIEFELFFQTDEHFLVLLLSLRKNEFSPVIVPMLSKLFRRLFVTALAGIIVF